MTQQELNGAKVFGAPVNQRGFGSSHGMRAIGRRIQAYRRYPAFEQPFVLPGRNVFRRTNPAREQALVQFELCLSNLCADGISRLLG